MTYFKPRSEETDELSAFERKLVKSLKCSGHLFPETDDEIRAFDQHFSKEIKASGKNIPNPAALLAKGRVDKMWTVKTEIDESVKENLAQAAREGKEIPDEIKRKMIDDRNNAKKK